MSFDYSAAKAAIQKAGHSVSSGPHILASDIKEIIKFGRRVFGLNEVAVRKGIGNPGLLPEGFPGAVAAPVAEQAPEVTETPAEAPVTPEATQAPAQEAQPAEDAPKAKKTKKADESAPTDTPAQDAPAQDAPAGEQAAQ
jgi:hypothetical protein